MMMVMMMLLLMTMTIDENNEEDEKYFLCVIFFSHIKNVCNDNVIDLSYSINNNDLMRLTLGFSNGA